MGSTAPTMPTDSERAEHIEALADLVEDIRTCMFTTIDTDGAPWSRPMATQKNRFDGTLWFFTRKDSEKIDHIERDKRVGAAFARPGDQEYVTMAGTASLVEDRATMEKLWSPLNEVWFPEGLDDPNLCLLRMDVDRAEYWDSPSSFGVYALAFAKSKLTGEPPKDLGDNVQVDF